MAIIDIGSNSVRLVVYERLARVPTPICNEKVLCGLGRGVSTSGFLGAEAIERALSALRAFRILCRNLGVDEIHVLATAAARDARNGAAFLEAATAALGAKIALIEGPREAELSALGVSSGLVRTDGVVGDMGGGSLELVDVRGSDIGRGVSMPLGGLALLDASRGSPKRAAKIARDHLAVAPPMEGLAGRTFYAVGGTWRALAKLHMRSRQHPLGVMHGYAIPADEALTLAPLVDRMEAENQFSVASARRPLLAYGAAVLETIVRLGRPSEVVISALGVREGLLFERLAPALRGEDPLLASARDINALRSRDPEHGPDLHDWTERFIGAAALSETPDDTRLRHAACLMADIAWRAHPDDRAGHALNAIANGTFAGADHPGRAFLALAVSHRHGGGEGEAETGLRSLLTPQRLERARLLGAAFRVAYRLSAAMGGVLPRTALLCSKARMTLTLPPDLADLAGERCLSRLKQLAKLVGREAEVRIV